MKFVRRFLWLLVVLGVLYVGAWIAGFFLIRNQIDKLAPQVTENSDLFDDFSDDATLSYEARSISGFPFGYSIQLDKPSLSHPLLAWKAEESVTIQWSIFRPLTADVDYSGSHLVAPALQAPMVLSADQATARFQVQPLIAARDARLSLISTQGEGATASVNDRPVFKVDRYALGLDTPIETDPANVWLDVFGFALSDDPEVQSRYAELLQRLGNAEGMLSALGLGLDRPIDHMRLRTRFEPFFPLAGRQLVLNSFVSRGGNILFEVIDVKQGNWRGRLSARLMFGPDRRMIVQSCPLLRAGSSYLPIPFMSVITLYVGGGRVDVSRDPVPEIALPKTVEPFTQRELCDVARTFVFADEEAANAN